MNRSACAAFSVLWLGSLLIGLLAAPMPVEAQNQVALSRLQKVLADRDKVAKGGFWIYHDLESGLAEAKRTGKPLLVVLRCIPCEECVKLDEELIESDEHLKPLLEQFVRVRIVGTNGLDLSLFQYDYDQSFAVFMLNADKTIYGRYGTRSHRTEWIDDVSLEGLGRALEGALTLHKAYPLNRSKLKAKTGPAPEFASPEKYPSLAEKYEGSLDFNSSTVVRSCIHCHQIGDAQRDLYRSRRQPLPEQLQFPYPHPKILGLIVDPATRGTLRQVTPGSPAAEAGLKASDEIVSLEGQPMLSIADMQWVLHHAGDASSLEAVVRRDGQLLKLQLPLSAGWRRQDDISWRVSSWGLRRMAAGGIKLAPVSADERKALGLADDAMALRAEHVGQYGPHAAAKNAGFRKGDILVSFDGRTDLLRETDLLAHGMQARKPGERVEVELIRDGKRLKLALPMQ